MQATLDQPTDASNWSKLNRFNRGEKVSVTQGQESFCNRLREMGFCELSEVQILNNNGAMLCQVCGQSLSQPSSGGLHPGQSSSPASFFHG